MRKQSIIISRQAVIYLFGALLLLFTYGVVVRPLNTVTAAAPEGVFTNASPITINTNAAPPTAATLYPSVINVTGMTGTTTKVTVTLNNITHPNSSELDILLVSPPGAKYVMMSDAGGNNAANNVTLTFDGSAGSLLNANNPLASGTFLPSSFAPSDTFPAPAPPPPYLFAPSEGGSTLSSAFNGADPNGTWHLYLADDQIGNSGGITDGWSITVTTTGTVATTFTNNAAIIVNDVPYRSDPATPYPSGIDVSGMTGVISHLTVTISGFSHTRSNDVDVLLVTPNGTATLLMSDVGNSASNATLTFDDGAANPLPANGPVNSGTYRPTNYDGFLEGGDFFAPPAPQSSFGSTLASLDGSSPNGVWGLYVVDDTELQAGSISGGWSIDITTTPYTPTSLGCVISAFSSPGQYPVESSPTNLATGDFNNDTKQDLVVVNQGANNVSVLLGDGNGGFGTASDFSVQSSPYSVAVGRFNNDANDDLVVVNSGSNNVSILLGNGMGGFSLPTNFLVGISPISVAVGDFNNDTIQDLAVANFGGFFAGTVSVLLGNGSGGFGPATSFGVRTQPSFVAIGDFNGDNNRDLAVSNFGSNNISILMGTGTGTFSAAPNFNVSNGPVSIAVADYNTDGILDLAVANYNSNNVSFWRGTGAGTFTASSIVNALPNPVSVVASDINSDGKPDIAIAISASNNIVTFLNSGTGTFSAQFSTATFTVGTGPNAIITGNFNADSKADLATANASSNNVSVLIGACAVARSSDRFDFTGDHRTDFAVYRPSAGRWYNFNVSPSGAAEILGTATDIPVPQDYDGDGKDEIGVFRPSTGTWIVPGRYFVSWGQTGDIPMPADYDGDGRADLAVYRPSEGFWYIRKSTDNGVILVPFGSSEDKPVARDFDGDGKADIAVFRPSNGGWYILQSSNGQMRGVQFGASGDRPVPADYEGDGMADVAVFRPSNGAWFILKSSNNSFVASLWGLSTDVPVPGDYDGDGKFDIAIWRPGDGVWYVLRSIDGSIQYQQWGASGDIPLPSSIVP